MSINSSAINSASINGVLATSAPALNKTTLDFTQTISTPIGQSTIVFNQNISQTGQSTLTFSQNVYSPASVADSWVNWDVLVLVNNVDVSDQLIDSLTIEANQSSARIAVFSVLLSGLVNPAQWIGKSVAINYLQNNGASWRRFSGVIQRANYSINSNVLLCTCSDDLQLVVDGYTNDQLKNISGGIFSEHIFNADASGWNRLTDLLRTADNTVELDSNRVLQSSELQNKIIADFTFTDNLILDNSLSVQLVERNQLVNKVNIQFDIRFSRLYHQDDAFIWNYSRTFCENFSRPITFPDRSMVKTAIESSGWRFISGSYTSIWPSGNYNCSGTTVIFANNFPDGMRGFNARASKRWSQSVTEQFLISVSSPSSIVHDGDEIVTNLSAASFFPTNFPDWVSSTDYASFPSGTVSGSNGSSILDDVDDVQVNAALAVLVAIATTTITQSHRKNIVEFDVPLSPYIELNQTVETIDNNVHAKGILSSFFETYNFDSGEAITKISLSISSGGSGTDTVSASAAEPIRATLKPVQSAINSTVIQDHVGGLSSSPVQDPAWSGLIINAFQPFAGSNIYNATGLHIPFAAIPDSETQNKKTVSSYEFFTSVPDNTLVINT